MKSLNRLGQRNHVEIFWVPAHNNQASNEKAHRSYTKEVCLPFSCDIKIWEQIWSAIDSCRTTGHCLLVAIRYTYKISKNYKQRRV